MAFVVIPAQLSFRVEVDVEESSRLGFDPLVPPKFFAGHGGIAEQVFEPSPLQVAVQA